MNFVRCMLAFGLCLGLVSPAMAQDYDLRIVGVMIVPSGSDYEIKVTTRLDTNIEHDPGVASRLVLKLNGVIAVDETVTFPVGGAETGCPSDCYSGQRCVCSGGSYGGCVTTAPTCVCSGCMADITVPGAGFLTSLSSGDVIQATIDYDDDHSEISETNNVKTVTW